MTQAGGEGRRLPTEARQAGMETDTQCLLSDGDSVLGGFASLPPTVGFRPAILAADGRLSSSVMQMTVLALCSPHLAHLEKDVLDFYSAWC